MLTLHRAPHPTRHPATWTGTLLHACIAAIPAIPLALLALLAEVSQASPLDRNPGMVPISAQHAADKTGAASKDADARKQAAGTSRKAPRVLESEGIAAPQATPTTRILKRAHRPGRPETTISYPLLGNRDIDADLERWVNAIADAFDESLQTAEGDDYKDAERRDSDGPAWELIGDFSVARPSPAAVSVTFQLWTYTGGAHGNRDIIALNYDMRSGQRLGLVDIFEDSDKAVELMSRWSRAELTKRLAKNGWGTIARMIEDGTAPQSENFSSLTLIPEGVCINFQEYQVAPYAAGPQKVTMPLEELREARPVVRLWGK
ncbi:MAG: DUF3298 and DUF4163 domain-containing protein [Desulfovibrio sp.]|jgi:hypothetical protein|nr:DUF3298 and DUF4163 domain-containing protein [Desulfovibrio sp.]